MPSLFRKQPPQSRTWSTLPCARAVHGAMDEPSPRAGSSYPQPGQAEQVLTQPGQGPHTWKQDRHSREAGSVDCRRLQNLMIEDILASLSEPELSRGHRKRNFPKAWRASQELSHSGHQWEPERLRGGWHWVWEARSAQGREGI